MSDRNRAEIIRAVFAAHMSNDRKAVEDALARIFSSSRSCNSTSNWLRNNFAGHVGAAKPGSSC